MLRNLIQLAEQTRSAFDSLKVIPEISLDSVDRGMLEKMECISDVHDHSFVMKKMGSELPLAVPSQYIFYAIVVKQYALALSEFWVVMEQCRSRKDCVELLQKKDFKSLASDLDPVSEHWFVDFLTKIPMMPQEGKADVEKYCKAILQKNKEKYTLRGQLDLFSSCVLNVMGVPYASSDLLAAFIFELCKNIDVYKHFEKKYLGCLEYEIVHVVNQADFNIARDVAECALTFLYQYDGLQSLGLVWNVGNVFVEEIAPNKYPVFLVEEKKDFLYKKTKKFVLNPLFLYDEKYVSVTSEWFESRSKLTPESLKKWLEKKYPDFEIRYEYAGNKKITSASFRVRNSKCGRAEQKILFGAPGTGKSHKIESSTEDGGFGLGTVLDRKKYRTTFHPDYDYAQFVGSYKPKMSSTLIKYGFVPQVFARAYAEAWRDLNQPVYLVIEEINRGNCAQIFGDIFQLLDRDENGFSRYEIDADADFAKWLKDEGVPGHVWDEHDGTKLRLPPKFNILATMNTSDQSLFPMDSAFKRRFDWKYVPIHYKNPYDEKTEPESFDKWKADQFIIDLGLDDNNPKWVDFLEKVNDNVYEVTKSEDKQMGEFFVNPDVEKVVDGKKQKVAISLDMFKSKVLFYLWDSVYKDEVDNEDAKKVFHFNYPEENGSPVTFQSLFGKNAKDIVKAIFKNLEKKPD